MGPNLQEDEIPKLMTTKLTYRLILSQVNGFYDPLGLVTSVTLRSKIMMAKLFRSTSSILGWDDPIPKELQREWMQFFGNLFQYRMLHSKGA